MERDLKEFKVYNSKNLQWERSVAGHRGNITCAEHIWDRDMLATSSHDLSIMFWDMSNWQKKGRIMTNDIQLTLRYYKDTNRDTHYFMSSGIDFMITFYNLDNMKPIKVIQPEKVPRVLNPNMRSDQGYEFRGHTAAITDILIVPARDIFFTCAMDAKIICWDLKILT